METNKEQRELITSVCAQVKGAVTGHKTDPAAKEHQDVSKTAQANAGSHVRGCRTKHRVHLR